MAAEDDLAAAHAAIRRLAAATGEDYRLVCRLAGGQTGAHEVLGPGDARLVVKWDDSPDGQAGRRRGVLLADRLREVGWPVPRHRLIEVDGRIYVVQDLCPGTPVERVDRTLVDTLLALHPLRLGLGADLDGRAWAEHLVETLTAGGAGYCRHESLAGHDARTRALVDRIEVFGATLDPGDFVGTDVVHWDLHPGNLLQVDGRLTAVIDNDFVVVGDARFDLVTIALASLETPCESGASQRLAAVAFDGLDPVRRQAYVGHLVLRCLDWAIRKGCSAEIDHWLAVADRYLPA